MNYTQVVKQLLDKQYPDKQGTKTITISTFNIKFIPLKAKNIFQSYSNLTTLSLVNCDLRKLQNFPIIPSLCEVDISSNNLQGTLNYLMPLKSLNYLNISQNIISEVQMLEPLKRLSKVQVYLMENPFTNFHNWKTKVKAMGIKVLKAPKQISNQGVNMRRKEAVLPVKEEEEDEEMIKPVDLENFKAKMLATFQINLEPEANQQANQSPSYPSNPYEKQSPDARRGNDSPSYIYAEQANQMINNNRKSPPYAVVERDSLSNANSMPASEQQQEMEPREQNEEYNGEQESSESEQNFDNPIVNSDQESGPLDWQNLIEERVARNQQQIELIEDDSDDDEQEQAEE